MRTANGRGVRRRGSGLRVGASLEDLRLTVEKVYRFAVGDQAAGQPLAWTFIEFEAPDGHVDTLTAALSRVLDPELGWYCDLRTDDETFVVFAGRAFRYPRGSQEARVEVEAYGRSVGVPEAQLDWPL